ncbi:MAG: methyltransferase domain-containing protein [Rhizobacter sp.]|nr:methyltransferase domain-containing protein [Ferruginibacter sp.]
MLSVATPAISQTDKWFSSDEKFHLLYPASIQSLATKHWTPLNVARKAARFLAAEKNVRILDIGSGVGKFCIGAAQSMPNAFYTGVEQRKKLVDHAKNAVNNLGLKNIDFIHGNFTQLNFKNYDHFYFYNSFYENFDFSEKIDSSITYSPELYHYYSRYLLKQLEQKPAGTRLATFHSLEDEVPEDFLVVGTEIDNTLKFWIKI